MFSGQWKHQLLQHWFAEFFCVSRTVESRARFLIDDLKSITSKKKDLQKFFAWMSFHSCLDNWLIRILLSLSLSLSVLRSLSALLFELNLLLSVNVYLHTLLICNNLLSIGSWISRKRNIISCQTTFWSCQLHFGDIRLHLSPTSCGHAFCNLIL